MRAVLLNALNSPLEMVQDHPAPVAGDGLVLDVTACGVCHSDIHVVDGDFGKEPPMILGHEVTGVHGELGPVMVYAPWGCRNCSECSQGLVIGAGGLGQYAIRYLRLLTDEHITALDLSESKRKTAVEIGADVGVDAVEDGAKFDLIIDFIGAEATLQTAASHVNKLGTVSVVGLAGGTIPFGFMSVPHEARFVNSVWEADQSSMTCSNSHARNQRLFNGSKSCRWNRPNALTSAYGPVTCTVALCST